MSELPERNDSCQQEGQVWLNHSPNQRVPHEFAFDLHKDVFVTPFEPRVNEWVEDPHGRDTPYEEHDDAEAKR